MPTPQDVRRTTTPIFSVLMVLIGIALLVQTIVLGGVVRGILAVLFMAAGAGRLYLAWKTPR